MIGKTLSQYRIDEKIGQGGMGEVYRAHDTQLKRDVALKVLPSGSLEDETLRQRFRQEAQALSRLNHPHIATIYEFDTQDGIDFLVMELIDGLSLADKLRAGAMAEPTVAEFACQIAEALAQAHEQGIVHRDLKPSNVMVTGKGEIKLLDFGLAKLLHAPATEETLPVLTAPHTTIGTLPYMAPEQLRGDPVDARTDGYALGAVLYEMATGKRPFDEKVETALIADIQNRPPTSPREVNPKISTQLEAIIVKCLEKDPATRYQSSPELCTDMERLKSLLVTTAPSTRSPATMKRWLFLGAAVAVVALLIGLFFWVPGQQEKQAQDQTTLAPRSTDDREKLVVLPFENMGPPEDKYFADGMTEEITSRLAAVEGLAVISRTSALQYVNTGKTIKQIGEELDVDYILEGSVRWDRAREGSSRVRVTPQLIRVADDTHVWSDRYDRVIEDIFTVQSDIAAQVLEQLNIALLEPARDVLESKPTGDLAAYDAYLRGNDFLHRGRELGSAKEIHFAIQMYEEAIQLDSTFALAYARQSVAHSWLYNVYEDRTEARLASAKEAADRALALDPELPEAHYALGYFYLAGDLEPHRALEEFQTVLSNQANNAEVFEAISFVQLDLGQWEEGRISMMKAMELNPRLGRLACWTGGRHFGLREFREALRYHDRAIRLTPDRSCPYFCKLNIYLNQDGHTGNARSFLTQLPQSLGLEESPPINYPWVMIELIDGRYEEALKRLWSGPSEAYEVALFYIPKDLLAAQIHELLGRLELAKAHYENARDLLEGKIRERPEDARFHSSLGIAYAGLGRREDAIREGKLGLELLGGSQNETMGFRVKDLAQIYVTVGDYDAAIDQLEHLLSVPAHISAPYLKIDPTFQALRDHPRFQELLRRHGA